MAPQAVETPQPGPDPLAADPFFKRGLGTDWNACIGRQGDEETRAASEEYEDRVAAAKRKHAVQGDRFETVDHLMSKTNFLSCIRLAAERLERPSLVRKLAQI